MRVSQKKRKKEENLRTPKQNHQSEREVQLMHISLETLSLSKTRMEKLSRPIHCLVIINTTKRQEKHDPKAGGRCPMQLTCDAV